MSGQDWRLSELQRDAVAARSNVAAWDARISELESMLVTARAAEGEYLDDLARLRGAAAELRRTTPRDEMWIDADGFPQTGPLPSVIRRHDELLDAIAARERAYTLWVEERRIAATDAGGLDRSWSPRRVVDVERQLGAARRARAFAGVALERLEAQLSPGERCQAGHPADDYVAHRQRIQALHGRLG